MSEPKTFQTAVAIEVYAANNDHLLELRRYGMDELAEWIEAGVSEVRQTVIVRADSSVELEASRYLWEELLACGLRGVQALTDRTSEEAEKFLCETVVAKQRSYGVGNIMAFGSFGVLVRLSDKAQRIKHLLETGHDPGAESLADSYLDVAGYSCIALLLQDGWFTLPLAEDLS